MAKKLMAKNTRSKAKSPPKATPLPQASTDTQAPTSIDEEQEPPAPKLTAKERAFVEEYLVDLNGTQAAIRAKYSPKSAAVIASENLRKPHIAAAIERALAERPGVTRARVVEELAAIAFSDVRKVADWGIATVVKTRGKKRRRVQVSRLTLHESSGLEPSEAAAISEVSQAANGTLRIKLHDKAAALDKLARVLAMFRERVEHTGAGGGPIETKDVSAREIVERRIAGIASRIK